MSAQQWFFAYLSFMMVLISVLVITRKNPVHSVIWMLVLFVHIAGVYVFLKADFLAAVQIIVYAGATLVLFLFVIMLLNLKKEELEKKFQREWPLGFVVVIIFIILFAGTLAGITVIPLLGKYSVSYIDSQGVMMTIGRVLYTEYLLPFEIASLILLVAILGAVVLAKKKL
jgi:NADH-quinone oxidoreductase subunit J